MTIRVSRRGGKEQIAQQAYHQVHTLPHTTTAKPELREIKTRKDRRNNSNASFYFVIPPLPDTVTFTTTTTRDSRCSGSPML